MEMSNSHDIGNDFLLQELKEYEHHCIEQGHLRVSHLIFNARKTIEKQEKSILKGLKSYQELVSRYANKLQ